MGGGDKYILNYLKNKSKIRCNVRGRGYEKIKPLYGRDIDGCSFAETEDLCLGKQ